MPEKALQEGWFPVLLRFTTCIKGVVTGEPQISTMVPGSLSSFDYISATCFRSVSYILNPQ